MKSQSSSNFGKSEVRKEFRDFFLLCKTLVKYAIPNVTDRKPLMRSGCFQSESVMYILETEWQIIWASTLA